MSEFATFGGGCFWCLDAAYRGLRGVLSVTSGFAGGEEPDPSYDEVVGGGTGHAEVVRVEFDPGEVSYEQLLDVFWALHDPTTPNRQGSDVGPQYRSIILYESEEQRAAAVQSRGRVQALWSEKVVTEILPLEHFYPADEEHQDFFAKRPNLAYCQVIINPKLEKLREHYQELLS